MLSFYHIEGLMSKAISVYGNNSVMDDTLDGNDAALNGIHGDMLDMNNDLLVGDIQLDNTAGAHRNQSKILDTHLAENISSSYISSLWALLFYASIFARLIESTNGHKITFIEN